MPLGFTGARPPLGVTGSSNRAPSWKAGCRVNGRGPSTEVHSSNGRRDVASSKERAPAGLGGMEPGGRASCGSLGLRSPPAHWAPASVSPCSILVQCVPPWGSPSPPFCVTDAVFLGSAAITKHHRPGGKGGHCSAMKIHVLRVLDSGVCSPDVSKFALIQSSLLWRGGAGWEEGWTEGGNSLVPLLIRVLIPPWGPHPQDLL